ncbi:MAG: hypothetical protein FD165_2430 [Gammaproteobacteria bacterium]|nr:MAG: hypothetical protein FD165_2430 [Gammaproteobacteria bacterium]TND03656.1 MAG: hypothetical protein FD120_1812 [Gammaproteobacteria bacterium]
MINAPLSAARIPGSVQPFIVAALTVVLLAAVAAIYYPGLYGPFMLDDLGSIGPARLNEFKFDKIIGAVFGNESGILGRPVSAFSFAMTHYFHGMDAFYFKYHNLMLHLLNGVLLFWLGGRLLTEKFPETEQQRAWLAAGIVATIWLIHPLWVSTVLYAVQRMALLSTLFTIMALITYVTGRQKLASNPRSGLALMTGGTIVFGTLAVFSKENAALLPFYIVAIEAFVFRFHTVSTTARNRLYLFHIVFVAIPVSVGSIYFISHLDAFLSGYAMREFTLPERLMTEARVAWFYMALLLLPRLSSMSLFHDDYPVAHSLDPIILLAIMGLLALLASAAWSFRRHPVLGFGITWFFAAHLLESTVLPLELVFEHRNYLAAFGVFLPVGFYSVKLCNLDKNKIIPGIIFALIFVGLAAMTFVRAQSWGNDKLFYRITVMEHPNSFRAHTSIANIDLANGDPESARQHLVTALSLSPENSGTMVHLLYTYCHADTIPSELVDQTTRLLEHGRLVAYGIVSVNMLAASYFRGDCPAMTPETILNVTFAATKNRSAGFDDQYYLLVVYGQTLQLLKLHEEAIRAFSALIALAGYAPPTNRPLGLVGLAQSSLALGKDDQARDAIRQLRILDEHPLISIGEQVSQLEAQLRIDKP